MKSCSPQALLFSFGLHAVVNLSTRFFIERIFTFLIFSMKNAFLMFFILGVNVFLHLSQGEIQKYNGPTGINTEIQWVDRDKHRNTTGQQGQIQKYKGTTGTFLKTPFRLNTTKVSN